ncbi:hypothetical protein [Zhengella mangrovi]|uniref:hypothetical protein n=1 Tax=Zhengella mangrovi TaxID=1982044 RepID=UPI001054B35E
MINALRAHLSEYGTVTAIAQFGVKISIKLQHEQQDELQHNARSTSFSIVSYLGAIWQTIDHLGRGDLGFAPCQ